ncbi:hypothetical protein [Mangrovicoccus algicola]|uniref:hypothetical protein n=1 Tax=Mangrovicoccus algicola TaxID=2771008 RepID=UPI001867F365|nr:hypothetical protein [Mangrovicoccus algicola]
MADFLAFGAMLAASVAVVDQLSAARISAAETRLVAEFEKAAGDMRRTVSCALEIRSSSMLAAVLQAADGPEAMQVSLANMPTDGTIFPAFQELARAEGDRANIVDYGRTAHGRITFDELQQPAAMELAEMIHRAPMAERQTVEVRLRFEPVRQNYAARLELVAAQLSPDCADRD